MKCRWAQSTCSTTTSELDAICSNSIDEASSSSSSASQSIYEMTNQTMPSMSSSQTIIETNANNPNIQMHNNKRQKHQQQLIDSEDTCSNDAFMFKFNQNGQQFNSNRNIPAVK